MNMNLYGHDDSWLMVDCGVTFDEPLAVSTRAGKNTDSDSSDADAPRFDRVCADPGFIAEQRESLVGIIITHAHEDHLGALVDLWPRLKCPVYTTAFTAICLRHKLAEARLDEAMPIVIMSSGQRTNIGPFEVQWLALTHSLPESHSLVIRTRAGTVFHTGDWKIDRHPVVGEPFDAAPFKQLANEPIDAMVCDSTNADRPGRTKSEGDCYTGLQQVISALPGKVLVTCFASNIGRLLTLFAVARETGRYVCLLGRSLENMVRHAKAAGYWPAELDRLLHEPHQLAYLPSQEILLIATGSQGEPRAALARLAGDRHRDIELEKGDAVIFSALKIPGNEVKIDRLIERLREKQITVIEARDTPHTIHASGHPSQQDLLDLYGWVKPRLAIPTHGEWHHIQAHAELAKAAGVPRQLTGLNGDLFEIGSIKRVHRQFTTPGRIPLAR